MIMYHFTGGSNLPSCTVSTRRCRATMRTATERAMAQQPKTAPADIAATCSSKIRRRVNLNSMIRNVFVE